MDWVLRKMEAQRVGTKSDSDSSMEGKGPIALSLDEGVEEHYEYFR